MVTFYIVDDEDMIREGMQYYFPWDQYGVDVTGSAINGVAALQGILRLVPDVVLTDVVMPKMDGIELARNLRRLGYSGEIVFLSAYQEMEYVKAAFKCAAADFLFKPIQSEEMDETIREMVSRVEKKLHPEHSRQIHLSTEADDIRIIRRIKDLIAGDPACACAHVLAGEVHLSKNYLASLFKRYTGQTLNDYISGVRLEKAAALLCGGCCYIYEAADRVGYKDVAYFSKLFKQQYGCTPAEYKKTADQASAL